VDAVHLHLALNHVPVLGTVFVAVALVVSLWRKNAEFVRLSLWATMLISGASIAIKFTGDAAWEDLRPWPQPYDGARVERHESAADQATTGVFVAGVAAAAVLFIARRRPQVPAAQAGMVVTFLLVTFLLMARTANLGGQLRHPHLRGDDAGAVSPNSR
jgi:uncharacterized membrane protein